MKMNKKGQVMLYIYFIIIAVTITTLAAVLIPATTRINTEMFISGENLVRQSQTRILGGISDSDIKSELNASFEGALAAAADNIETSNFIYQYSWLIIVFITGMIVFIYSRQIVETNKQYGGGFV